LTYKSRLCLINYEKPHSFMKKWYKIEEFVNFRKVIFYTIRHENEVISETDKFLLKYSEQTQLLNKLVVFIEAMGNEFGAKQLFFRHEAAADALPPPYSAIRQYGLLEFIEYDLRLYCCRLSDSVVILYGGGQKTTAKAQDCPNVASHFRLASLATKAFNEKIKDKSFALDFKQIRFNEEAEIEF
jgi:hypothetical protein